MSRRLVWSTHLTGLERKKSTSELSERKERDTKEKRNTVLGRATVTNPLSGDSSLCVKCEGIKQVVEPSNQTCIAIVKNP